ncbi:MAG: ROK family transcriptional regulator [Micromonosporaceae bacterium]|nr:ROK family transcriptional regulator [Micromonosporaceae bacterium]
MQTGSGPQPADFADVRATNLAVVLRFVRANAPCSRADIAASTGLNKATVSSLVADLIDRRLVRETGLTERRIGRPATQLVLDGSPYAAVGLEVNADYLSAVAVDLAGQRLLSWRRTFAGSTAVPSKAVAAAAALGRRAAARMAAEGRQVLGLTLAVPGLVDAAGRVPLAPALGWRDVPALELLRQALGEPAYPVAVDNDASLAAVAEYRYGAYAGTPNLVYLGGGSGIGAGLVVDGRAVRGGHGYVGELGHIQLDPGRAGRDGDGPECECGRRGCLQAVAGVGALVRRLLPDAIPDGGAITDLEPEVDELVRRAGAGDPATTAALAEAGRWLGHAVSVLANLINPQVVVFGGYFVPLADWLLPAAEAEARAGTLAPDLGGCRLVPSTLGHGAAAVGGAARVLDAVDAGQLPQLLAAGPAK